jgi:hypothetical protein
VQVSATSHGPAEGRHTVDEGRKTLSWHWAELPVQVPAASHGPLASAQINPSGLNWLGGHWASVPVQNSGRSHGPAEGRHSRVEGKNTLSWHWAELPVQVPAASHGPLASKQTVPAGLNWFSGHCGELAVHSSGRSHGPAAARHTVPTLSGSGIITHCPATQAAFPQDWVFDGPGHLLPQVPQLFTSVWTSTHSPTWGRVPPGHACLPVGQTHRLPAPQVAPVGQQRLPQTKKFGQQNLSVPEVSSVRQV